MGSASIAPRAAPSASERSSESRLRLVRGFGFLCIRSSFARPVFRSCGKGISQPPRCPAPGARRRAAARAVRLGCPGSVLAHSIAQKPPALHGYRRRIFNRLDGHTARRVKPSHRPAGLTSAVGRNVPKYVAGPPASPSGQAGQSCGGLSPDFRAGGTGPSPRREAAGEIHTICTLSDIG